MKVIKSHKCFEGSVRFWEHDSKSTQKKMNFSTFNPASQIKGALIWLSSSTCTNENFIAQTGVQKILSDNGLMVICPEASPRSFNLPSQDDDNISSFYVNATTPVYRDYYKMYDYVASEIHSILKSEFGIENRVSISGYCEGGLGALVIGLREVGKFSSISAFAPIVNPILSAWGEKAFTTYLGSERSEWLRYDACSLVAYGASHPKAILIDQGTKDEFLETQLKPEKFRIACAAGGQELILRMREGYDHSDYFISSFIQEHIEFHAQFLA